MQKKSMFVVLGTVLACIVTSLVLVFTVGPKVRAEDVIIVPEYYLRIENNILRGFQKGYAQNVLNDKYYSIIVPNNVVAVDNISVGSGLISITLPENLETIYPNAFSNSSLTSIIIPKKVKNISGECFSGCSKLNEIIVDSENETYKSINDNCIIRKSDNCLIRGSENTVVAGVSKIGNFAFSGCSGLTSITIPDSVTSIGDNAFYGCSGLTSITIPDSVTSIGSAAFSRCRGLTSIQISSNITRISNNLLSDCSSLTGVEIPIGVVYCGMGAFSGCKDLTSITISESVTSIGSVTFSGCSSLTTITIPDSVSYIGDNVFLNCTNLISIIVKNPALMTNANLRSYRNKMHCYLDVTFDSKGGNDVESQTVDYENCASEPTVSRTGYGLDYWYTTDENVPFDFNTPITENITLKAKWVAEKRNVFFHTGDGTRVPSQIVDYNTTADEPEDPIRTGYTFGGWYTDENCTNEYNFGTVVTDHVNLYAQWNIINQYDVTFDSQDGSAVETQHIDYNSTATKPVDPTKVGFTFAGWFIGDDEYDFTTPVIDNVTLTAKWEPVPSNNKTIVIAVGGGVGGVAGLGALGTIIGVAVKKRKK